MAARDGGPAVVEPDGTDRRAVAAQPLCTGRQASPVELLYASPGADESLRFLIGCPGEVIVGEKREAGPLGAMKIAGGARAGRPHRVRPRSQRRQAARAANRTNGVERTAAYLRHKLAIGYDYIVIDEITTAPRLRATAGAQPQAAPAAAARADAHGASRTSAST